MNLGQTIRKIRKQRGLTQAEFALRCELSQTYLSQIEGDLREPNLSTLKSISTNLNVPLPIIFFLSMTKEDIPAEKQDAFDVINPSVKSFVNEFFAV
jgi:transcriptional regulator with XRE-family HTH domain